MFSPAPWFRDRFCLDTAIIPLSSDGEASPDKRRRPRSPSPKEYRPKSPQPQDLDVPEQERPSSWYPAGGPIEQLPSANPRGHKQFRSEGFRPYPLTTSPAPVPGPKRQQESFDLPLLRRPVSMPLLPKLRPTHEGFHE